MDEKAIKKAINELLNKYYSEVCYCKYDARSKN